MFQVLRKRAIGMLTAGMSTRAVAREFNVNFSTISRLQHCFEEFGSTSGLTTADHMYGTMWVSSLLTSTL
jgi:transposase